MALAVAGASFVGTLTAALDAAWARAALDGSKSAPFTTLARIDTGLVAPFAMAIGVLVGGAAFALEPDRARSPSEIWRGLDTSDRARNDRLAGFLLALGLGLGLWATQV